MRTRESTRLAPAQRAVGEPGRVPAAIVRVDVHTGRHDLVDLVENVGAERRVKGWELTLKLVHGARADDRRSHRWMAQDERERHLDQRDAGLLGEVAERLH